MHIKLLKPGYVIFVLQYVDPGDLTERYELKKRCPRNFSYYIEKTFPEMGVDAISFAWQGVRLVVWRFRCCYCYDLKMNARVLQSHIFIYSYIMPDT